MLNKEIQDIRTLLEGKVEKDLQPLIKAYKVSLDEIQTQIAKIYVQYAVDGVISISKKQRVSVLLSLEDQIVEQMKQLGSLEETHTTKTLENVYSESYYRTAYTLDAGISTSVNFALLKPEFVLAAVNIPMAGKMFSSRIWDNKDELANHLKNELQRGIIQGIDVRKLARNIKARYETSAFNSKRLVYTEMSRVMGDAQQQIYSDSGVVQKILWDATLDGKTSEICRSRDGKTYDLGSVPTFPAHPFERSCLVPVVKGWSPTIKKENVKNADSGKSNINYATYEDWAISKGL